MSNRDTLRQLRAEQESLRGRFFALAGSVRSHNAIYALNRGVEMMEAADRFFADALKPAPPGVGDPLDLPPWPELWGEPIDVEPGTRPEWIGVDEWVGGWELIGGKPGYASTADRRNWSRGGAIRLRADHPHYGGSAQPQ